MTINQVQPEGELCLQLPACSDSTNIFGDVYGGWVSSQVVKASEIFAAKLAQGRISTVSIGSMAFMTPVRIGTLLSFHATLLEVGNSSLRVKVEVWGRTPEADDLHKITETECVQVAINAQGHIRTIPSSD